MVEVNYFPIPIYIFFCELQSIEWNNYVCVLFSLNEKIRIIPRNFNNKRASPRKQKKGGGTHSFPKKK